MKHFYLLVFSLLLSFISYSQLTLTSLGNGLVDVSYGATGDLALYDPQGETVVLYLWIDQAMNSESVYYEDQWNDNSTLINLTYDGTSYVSTIDFNTHIWDGGTIIPVGTVLNDFNILLRNPDGTSQSADLVATTYGYTATSLPVETFENVSIVVFLAENNLHIKGLKSRKNYSLSIFDTMGKQVEKLNSTSELIDISDLRPAVYFLILETDEGETIKKKILKF